MQQPSVVSRQIALFSACVLPVYKLLELPSLLARKSNGDLLLPALFQFALQLGVLLLVLYAIKNGEGSLYTRLQNKLGKWTGVFAVLFGAFYLLYAVLPILDLEKFTYAVFYDTAPTAFSFGFFFLVLAFISCQPLSTVGRFGDISLFLTPFSFFALIVMAFSVADLSALLPIAQMPAHSILSAVRDSAMPFADVVLLLPLLMRLEYKKGDAKKIGIGYGAGIVATLLFLSFFYGVYSSSAGREHYAFSKIAQYFPALSVVGRIDLLFVYLLCVALFFYACVPLLYAVRCVKQVYANGSTALISGVLAFAFFLFTLFCNKYYDSIYAFFSHRLYPVFFLFSTLLPISLLFLTGGKRSESRASTK